MGYEKRAKLSLLYRCAALRSESKTELSQWQYRPQLPVLVGNFAKIALPSECDLQRFEPLYFCIDVSHARFIVASVDNIV